MPLRSAHFSVLLLPLIIEDTVFQLVLAHSICSPRLLCGTCYGCGPHAGIKFSPKDDQGGSLFSMFVYTPGPPDQDIAKMVSTREKLMEAMSTAEPK